MIRLDRRTLIAACAGLTLVGLAWGLDRHPLLDPDEGRNAEVAREMAASNDYVLPRLNRLPYLDKPVGYFAAGAAAMEVLGPTVLAARLPSLLFTLATLGVIAWFGQRRFGVDGGWLAAAFTATSPLTLGFARTVIMDSAVTLFMVVALVAFCEAVEGRSDPSLDPTARPAERPAAGAGPGVGAWAVVAWAAIGVGILFKGPIALALPFMVAAPYAVWRRRFGVLFNPVGLLLCVAIVLPWVRAVSLEVPGFVTYVLRTETLERLTTDRLQRTGPWWYFLAILPAAAFPWSVATVAAGWTARRRPGAGKPAPLTVFLLLWILVPLVFFTLSQSKRPQYVLPLMPAVGLLLADLWTRRTGGRSGVRAAAGALAALGGLLLAVHGAIPSWVRMAPATAAAIPDTARWLGGVSILAAALSWPLAARPALALPFLLLPAAALPLVSGRLMHAIGEERSASALAQAVRPVLEPATQVVAVGVYPLSLPFYLGRELVVSTATGRELTSNFLARTLDRWRQAPGSPLRAGDWWRDALLECRRPRVFVVASDDRPARALLDARLTLLVETSRFAAYGPCGATDLAQGPPGPMPTDPVTARREPADPPGAPRPRA